MLSSMRGGEYVHILFSSLEIFVAYSCSMFRISVGWFYRVDISSIIAYKSLDSVVNPQLDISHPDLSYLYRTSCP
jgi:hypothetical protein